MGFTTGTHSDKNSPPKVYFGLILLAFNSKFENILQIKKDACLASFWRLVAWF